MRVYWAALPQVALLEPLKLHRDHRRLASISRVRLRAAAAYSRKTAVGVDCSEGCGRLSELNISWCVSITDFGIEQLFHGCNNLKTLTAKGCESVRRTLASVGRSNSC